MKYKVLIADDEINAQNQLMKMIETYPELEVINRVYNGNDALQILNEKDFDLAFLDVGMPGLTGIEVVKELNAYEGTKKKPYIIFITAFVQHGSEAYDLGAIDYLVKPVSERRLDRAMEKFKIYSGSCRSSMTSNKTDHRSLLKETYTLTNKEIDICLLVKEGQTKEEIQRELGFSSSTMKTHLGHIYDKTGLSDSGKGTGRCDKFSRLLFLMFNLKQ